jgi:hypothetical protein
VAHPPAAQPQRSISPGLQAVLNQHASKKRKLGSGIVPLAFYSNIDAALGANNQIPVKDHWGFLSNQPDLDGKDEWDKNGHHWVHPNKRQWMVIVVYPLYSSMTPKIDASLIMALLFLNHHVYRRSGFTYPTCEIDAAKML